MFRLILLISTLFLGFIIQYEASNAATFIPGATIVMTGSNTSVRFDIASDLMNSGALATPAALTTGTKAFTGVFYGSGIGWIEFSTGTYQVSLDCGAQLLTSLTANCVLTGTGWSENVGDIYFNSGSTIVYNPNTGLLSGSALSFAGNIDLTGIALPLRAVTISESGILANHNKMLTVSGGWMYNGGNGVWNMKINPIASADTRISNGTNGIFNIDLSLATIYDMSITDTNGSETLFPLTVNPGVPVTTAIGGYYANTFCIANPVDSRCPDGATRIASTLDRFPPGGPVVANGTDTYNFTMKVRDAYGNKVSAGSMIIKYITTVKNTQTVLGDNAYYSPSNDGDAIVGDFANIFGESSKTYGSLVSDITYSIASSAPTNTTDNIIRLDSVRYLSGASDTNITPTNLSPTLTFSPLFTASTNSVDTPNVGTPNTFTTSVIKNDATSTIVPSIVTTLKIGGGTSSAWTGMTSDPGALCTNYYLKPSTENNLCDWTDIYMSSIATTNDSSFVFTGTYSPIVPFTLIEPTTIGTYIHYIVGATDILYRLPDKIINDPTLTPPRFRVLGQTSSSMGVGSQNRINIINSLREKISLLARNRTDYSTADYTVYTGNQTITDAMFASKRTIIVIGGNITIDDNISLHAHPLALIALTDTNNQGGNIVIKGHITDIHSTLVAEHGIISLTSSYQLYIHGSMISANTPREVAPTDCPYFALGCNPSDYDLPNMRSSYTSPINSSIGGAAYTNPLIIEADSRLIGDPPPAMNK